jgi:multidrug resistance protein, MATE family
MSSSYWSELRPTLALAIPVVVGQVGQHSLTIADSVMVGQTGVIPLAASAFAVNLFSVLLIFCFGLLTPVAVLAARAHGADQPQEVGEVLRHGLWISAGLGLALGFVVTLISPLLGSMGQPPEVVAVAQPYFIIIGWSLGPILAFQTLKSFCEASLSPWGPVLILAGGIGLNVGLNWLWIYGHWGFPAAGLAGAGWATLVTRILMVIALVIYVFISPHFREELKIRWWQPLRKSLCQSFVALGLPSGGQLIFESGAFGMASIMMGWFGAVPLAAHQITLNCAALTFMVPLGISMAVSIRISQAAGANQPHRLRAIGWMGVHISNALMLGTALFFFVMRHQIGYWFVKDEAVILLAAQLFIVAGVFQVADGVQVIGLGSLRGLGDVVIPMIIALIGYWGLALPGGYALASIGGWGPIGIWIGLAFGLLVAAIAMMVRFQYLTHLPKKS